MVTGVSSLDPVLLLKMEKDTEKDSYLLGAGSLDLVCVCAELCLCRTAHIQPFAMQQCTSPTVLGAAPCSWSAVARGFVAAGSAAEMPGFLSQTWTPESL